MQNLSELSDERLLGRYEQCAFDQGQSYHCAASPSYLNDETFEEYEDDLDKMKQEILKRMAKNKESEGEG